MASKKLVHTLEGHAMPIRSLCFSPDSKKLITGENIEIYWHKWFLTKLTLQGLMMVT